MLFPCTIDCLPSPNCAFRRRFLHNNTVLCLISTGRRRRLTNISLPEISVIRIEKEKKNLCGTRVSRTLLN
jgi:hypothetical protein